MAPPERQEARDEALRTERVAQFTRVMIPVAIAFLLSYLATAAWLRNTALLGAAGAVVVFLAALLAARRALARGDTARAALANGVSLLVMVALGVVFINFLYPTLLLIPFTAVIVVLPHLDRSWLRAFMLAAFAVMVWTAIWGATPPLFEPPPRWFQLAVMLLATAVTAAVTLRLTWVDSQRLKLALENAREAARVREEFLSVATHELKTPLTPLSLRLETLQREAQAHEAQPLAGRVLEHMDVCRRQVERLSHLVGELLDVTRLASGDLPLDRQEVELVSTTRELLRKAQPEATRTATTFEVSAPDRLVGHWDPVRLRQVLANLIENAIKYGPGKPVRVAISASLDGWARIEVRDRGIGITQEALKRIFQKFERGVSDRHYGGLGLGLYVSKQIVEAHGGRIWAESEGEGATFRVELPTGSAAVPLENRPAGA